LIAARGTMRELHALALAEEEHGVIAHHVTAPKRL
jgi:hypothetical protein